MEVRTPYHRPEPNRLRMRLLLICLALTVLWGFWVYMDYGKWRLIYQEMSAAETQKTRLNAEGGVESPPPEEDVAELRRQVTVLERAAQVDRIEQNQIRSMITELEEEKQLLQEELAFYKNILIASKDNKGLKLQALTLTPLNDKERYRFEVFLTRIAKGGRVTSGKINLVVHGQGSEGPADLGLSELSENGSTLVYRIKHFKRLSGVIALPEGFSPDTVTVTIQPDAAGSKPVEVIYRWTEILA